MQDTGSSIMARLKAATDDLHRKAEGRRLQRQLAKGSLSMDQYAAYLGQMYLVHRALEERIRPAARDHAAFAAVVRDYHWREPQLRHDLAFLGGGCKAIDALPGTRAMIAEIEDTATREPVALLGMLYVLEGSTNGSKFIATALRRAYGLEAGRGLSYLDPHGDLQRDRWLVFKRDMNAVGFTASEADAIIEAAKAVFRSVMTISDELIEPEAVAAV